MRRTTLGTLALIGLGSNLGDRKAILDGAIASLAGAAGVEVRAVSSYHETSPVGGPPGQGPFLNAAATVETGLSASALHDRLREIEREAGRVRVVRWGERSLDLDLLLFGNEVHATRTLTIPHPRMAVRRFVLAPAVEIAPELVDPRTRRTLSDLLANLDRRPSYVAFVGPLGGGRIEVFRRLAERLSATGVCSGGVPLDFLAIEGTGDYRPLFINHLEYANRELRRGKWSEEIWGNRWILTDHWLDSLWVAARMHLPGAELPSFRERFLETQAVTIAPTFVAVWDPPAESLGDFCRFSHIVNLRADQRISSWLALREGYRAHLLSPECRPPILWPDPLGPDAFADEVLAACLSTRDGEGIA